MNKAIGAAETDQLLEVEIGGDIDELKRTGAALVNAEGEKSADDLGILLRRVSEASTREIENLIGELRGLRNKLQSDGSRIQNDIAKYAELSQGVLQLATIISDSVKKLPGTPRIGR
jgi:hypothetical protein